MMVELIAIKKCGKYNPGDTFSEYPGHARLLVTIKAARYLTRDMVADRDPEIKRGRGRPRLLLNTE